MVRNAKELPVDLKLLIMSILTMKEAARTCLISQSWNYAWHSLPVLLFEPDSSTIKRIGIDYQQVRSDFTRWVNSVVNSHIGSIVVELTVKFDLDFDSESDIDNWLVFALSREVQRLHLDFKPIRRSVSLIDCYSWPIDTRLSYLGLHRKLGSLRSLCLKHVNVTPKDIECILFSCTVLEELCIVGGCMYLTDITYSPTSSSSLQLKHLEVSNCPRMMCIDILAPKLVSFTYNGHPLIALDIRDASLLSKVSIGCGNHIGEVLMYAYNSLSKYFSQLEHLSWHLPLIHRIGGKRVKWNLGIKNPPVMKNLKHLVLHVQAKCDESLLGWASLIEASPVLQRLTLEFSGKDRQHGDFERNIVKHHVMSPLKSLKTLELVDYNALPMEFEFVTFIVENSLSLEEVILLPCKTSVCLNLPSQFIWHQIKIFDEFNGNMRSRGVVVTYVDF